MLVIRQTPENGYLDPVIVVFLIFLRNVDPELTRALVAGQAQAGEVMEKLRELGPGGEAFYYSNAGTVIEAHLLYAHSIHRTYVGPLLDRIRALPAEDNAENVRSREVGRRYDSLQHAYFSRSWIDLGDIDRRINLVSTDILEK
ncbi:hypothetical protein D9M68_567900 [compost metagenome]